jgi:hypothetical protein
MMAKKKPTDKKKPDDKGLPKGFIPFGKKKK